jgi:hypothetical protein
VERCRDKSLGGLDLRGPWTPPVLALSANPG